MIISFHFIFLLYFLLLGILDWTSNSSCMNNIIQFRFSKSLIYNCLCSEALAWCSWYPCQYHFLLLSTKAVSISEYRIFLIGPEIVFFAGVFWTHQKNLSFKFAIPIFFMASFVLNPIRCDNSRYSVGDATTNSKFLDFSK